MVNGGITCGRGTGPFKNIDTYPMQIKEGTKSIVVCPQLIVPIDCPIAVIIHIVQKVPITHMLSLSNKVISGIIFIISLYVDGLIFHLFLDFS